MLISVISVEEMIEGAEKQFVFNVRAYANEQAWARKPLKLLF